VLGDTDDTTMYDFIGIPKLHDSGIVFAYRNIIVDTPVVKRFNMQYSVVA